jgi:hypothetical protein
MIKAQVCGIKTMMDGDVRLTLNVPQEVVPNDIITWAFEDVVIVTKADIKDDVTLTQNLEVAIGK